MFYPGMKDPVLVLDDDVSKRRRLRPVRSCDSLLSAATTTPVKHSGRLSLQSLAVDLLALGGIIRMNSTTRCFQEKLK